MAEVIIDGTLYAPVTHTTPRIGVAITTRNRRDIYARARTEWDRFLPPGATLIVVDDASDIPAPDATWRFDTRVGIARAKNKCLELLDDAGVEHFFLADDDTYPLSSDWWRPYIDSPEPHLMHIFANPAGPGTVARDGQHIAYTDPRGCFLYCHRNVLDVVGGMDPCYGMWGHEHVDWSNRIHNARLTTWRYADVEGSGSLIRCLDDTLETVRSVNSRERKEAMVRNTPILNDRIAAQDSRYVEYRQQRDVVLTTWLTGPDIQRRGRTDTTPLADTIRPLRDSVQGADLIVLTDTGDGDEDVTELGLGIYLSRWPIYFRWLRDHPDVRFAFLVDAGDVEMARPLWDDMAPGVLYVGWEAKTVDDPWMVANHKAAILQDYLTSHHDQLLNCGVVGGDRATLLEFCHRMTAVIEDNAAARHNKTETHDLGTDMGPLNMVAHTHFADRLVTGSYVTTVFKAFDKGATSSGWRHK